MSKTRKIKDDPKSRGPNQPAEKVSDKTSRGAIFSGAVGALAGAALRGAVYRELSQRKSAADMGGIAHQHSPSRKWAAFGIKALVTKSVPGAVAVASGLAIQTLYRRRRARKAIDTAGQPEE